MQVDTIESEKESGSRCQHWPNLLHFWGVWYCCPHEEGDIDEYSGPKLINSIENAYSLSIVEWNDLFGF